MEQSVEIVPEFGSFSLRSSLFIMFVSCCKYKFDFCKVKSVLASENDIFVDGSSKETSRPTGDETFCALSGSTEVKADRVEWILKSCVVNKIFPPNVENW